MGINSTIFFFSWNTFRCFQLRVLYFFSFLWIKGKLKAQKLWSNWVALSSKTVTWQWNHSGLTRLLSASTACNTFLTGDPVRHCTCVGKSRRRWQIHLTDVGGEKKKSLKKASKTHTDKETLSCELHLTWVYLKQDLWSPNCGGKRKILHWAHLWNNARGFQSGRRAGFKRLRLTVSPELETNKTLRTDLGYVFGVDWSYVKH